MVLFPPALAVAAATMVSVIADTAGEPHPALGLAVRVRVTVPAVLSAALGVYTGFKIAVLLYVPVPDVVHASVR